MGREEIIVQVNRDRADLDLLEPVTGFFPHLSIRVVLGDILQKSEDAAIVLFSQKEYDIFPHLQVFFFHQDTFEEGDGGFRLQHDQ